MPGYNITLFKIFGLEIRVNISWAFIAVLLAWSLAQGYFPSVYEGLPKATYWWMGVAGVIGLFASIVLHELAHSLVAQSYGMKIKGITLWLLGGVAELGEEPPSPEVEFWMAIAGPAMSIALAVVFYGAAVLVPTEPDFKPLFEVLRYLALINLILVIFNLIPAFPMDGGRVLRAWHWHRTGNAQKATTLAAKVGSTFGLVLILTGLATVIFGFGHNGLWWVVLGMFIRFAADSARHQSEITHTLHGQSVLDFMSTDPIAVPSNIDARQFRDTWILRYHHKVFPVVDKGRVTGVISTRHLIGLDPNTLDKHIVLEMMDPISSENSIAASAAAEDGLKAMHSTGNSRLLVMEKDELIGMISLKDLFRVIAVRAEIGA